MYYLDDYTIFVPKLRLSFEEFVLKWPVSYLNPRERSFFLDSIGISLAILLTLIWY